MLDYSQPQPIALVLQDVMGASETNLSQLERVITEHDKQGVRPYDVTKLVTMISAAPPNVIVGQWLDHNPLTATFSYYHYDNINAMVRVDRTYVDRPRGCTTAIVNFTIKNAAGQLVYYFFPYDSLSPELKARFPLAK